MSSIIDICNMALNELGEDPITSLTEETEAAELCNRFFVPTRDEVLRAFSWNFAIERQGLALLAEAPLFEFDHAYQLPTDPFCLRVLTLEDALDTTIKWKIEGRKLLTNLDSVKIKYISRVEDTGVFDPIFTSCFSIRLASRLAMGITERKESATTMFQLYKALLAEARTIDSQEGSSDDIDNLALLEVRQGGNKGFGFP